MLWKASLKVDKSLFIKDLLDQDLETAIKEALQQIEDRRYETELMKRGVRRIIKLAIIFKGQQVKVVEGKSRGP